MNGWPESSSVLILVDFSAIAYACWATAESAENAGKESLAQHIVTCSVCAAVGESAPCEASKLIKQYNAHEVLKTNLRQKMSTIEEHTGEVPNNYVMVKDTHPKWKYDLFPAYKGDRPARFNPRPEAEAYLREAFPGMKWVSSPGNEADDCIATLVRVNKGHCAIVIVSGDKDLHQLYEQRVKVFNPVTKRFLDLDGVAKKFYGLGPRHIRAAKAFWGDPSDSLPNCAPRQQKQLVPLIQEADGDLFKMVDLQKRVSETCRQHLIKNHEQILINWKLAGLDSEVEIQWE